MLTNYTFGEQPYLFYQSQSRRRLLKEGKQGKQKKKIKKNKQTNNLLEKHLSGGGG